MQKERWTDEQIEYLKANFENKTCAEIALEIGKTSKATQHKFGQLGLKRKQPQVGETWNRFTIKSIVLEQEGNQQYSFAYCKCECGNLTRQKVKDIKSGHVVSCGCNRSEKARTTCINKNTTHSMTGTKIYGVWNGMLTRCSNTKAFYYKNYGGRGIKVCDEWKVFDGFYAWAKDGYKEGLQLDRIDTNGNYEPSNCRWLTAIENNNNKRSSRFIEAFGEKKTLAQWTRDDRFKARKAFNISYRIALGWSPENAISTPPLKKTKVLGQPENIQERVNLENKLK